MKRLKPPTSLSLCAVVALLAGGSPLIATAATTLNLPLVDPFYAGYPADCGGGPVTTGLCLLASTSPTATGDFRVTYPPSGGSGTNIPRQPIDIPVLLNARLPLPPGTYLLSHANGMDDRHAMKFTVTQDQVTTIKTATLKFQDSAGKYNKLQHYQAADGVNGAGCNAEIGTKGVRAYLPGDYYVGISATLDNATPKCGHEGIAFNITAGQAATIRPGSRVTQTLPSANIYQHPTKALSLTNIDHLRHDVSKVGFLSKFKSFNGIHNPSSATVDGLVLSGAPNFHFVVPVLMNNTASCGLSIPGGGLPPRNLLTRCVFDGNGNLTRFQINAGQYFSFDNTHGKSGVAGHVINSPVLVSGVKFNLKGN